MLGFQMWVGSVYASSETSQLETWILPACLLGTHTPLMMEYEAWSGGDHPQWGPVGDLGWWEGGFQSKAPLSVSVTPVGGAQAR